MSTFLNNLTRKHSYEYVMSHFDGDASRKLRRVLDWKDIAIFAVSVCIGAGIFSVGAKVIAFEAGPSAIISFVVAGVVCALAAMCYAEFASVLPVSGSAYTYSYTVLGEFVAWVIGWNLLLELFAASSVIMKYWCIYLYNCIKSFFNISINSINFFGLSIDIPIVIFSVCLMVILILGAELSAKVTKIFVCLKLAILLFVIIVGFIYFNPHNLIPFIPDPQIIGSGTKDISQSLFSFILGQQPYHFGIFGIFAGAGIIFFAFIGFDMAASVSEETVNPRRNMPIGLIVGVIVVTVIYSLVALVTTGMVSQEMFAKWALEHQDESVSLTTAFEIIGQSQMGAVIALGITIGLISVILVAMLGFTRIVFAMSRDGLLPRRLSVVSTKYHTPHRIIIFAIILMIFVTSFASIDVLSELINIGTLSAFIIVSFAVPIFRKQRRFNDQYDVKSESEISQTFRVPFSPFLPILSGVVCIWLAMQLAISTWMYFVIWLFVGAVFYFIYGYHNSQMSKHPEYVKTIINHKERTS